MGYWARRIRFMLALLMASCLSTLGAEESGAGEDQVGAYSEDMSPEELQKFAAALYTMEIKTPISLEDVKKNDSQRMINLGAYVPTRAAQQKVLPYLCAIPRPDRENEIIFEEITTLLSNCSDDNQRALGILLRRLSFYEFCMSDVRIYTVLKNLVVSQCHIKGKITASYPALEFLGCIHIPECIEFLSRARYRDYWEQETPIKTLEGKARSNACYAMLNATFAAIEHLPLNTGIRLLEEMYAWPEYSKDIRCTVLKSLDQLWQKKKGEYHLRGEIRSMPWGGYAPGWTRYPEWLYGPGGARIDWPFGLDPNKTEEQRVRDAEALSYYQKMFEDRAEEAFRNAEAERKKKAQEEAAAPK